MSYQTASDRVEALRNIRGGRLTKWKGVVVGCAPTMGAVALAISTLGFAGAANAANECGVAGATVICDAADAGHPNYPTGITYSNVAGAMTLTLNDAAIVVGNPGVSVSGSVANTGAITVNGTSFGTITTTGTSARGISAQTAGLGAALAQMDGGTVTTGGASAYGLYSNITNTSSSATATALLTSGDVITQGGSGSGLYARNLGLGDVRAQMDGGTVTTGGVSARGLYSVISNAASTATASALLTAGDVVTVGDSGIGIYALTSGLGDTLAQMDGGTITTAGVTANGIYSVISNAASTATATVLMKEGLIRVTGSESRGIAASGSGAAVARMDGGQIIGAADTVRAIKASSDDTSGTVAVTALLTAGDVQLSGANLVGIYGETLGNGDALAQIDGGKVTLNTTSGYGYGLLAANGVASNTGDVKVLMTGGEVETSGGTAALLANQVGLGDALAQMDGGTVKTAGSSAIGLSSKITNASSTAASTSTMTSGTVTTSGHGVHSLTSGTGLATATVAGDAVVNAGGVGADGIRTTISQAAATYAVAVDGTASVTGGFGTGAGIHTVSVAGSTGTVTVGVNAVVDGSRGAAGIVDDAGNTTMAINGKLLGGISAGAGDDVANLNAGSTITGSVAMGDGSDVVRIASGADVSGLTLLDGGDDLTAADGFIDVLSVDGLSGAVDGSIIRNWEEINVANSNVQVANLVAGAVSVTDSTVVATNLTADKVSLTNSTTTIGGTSVVATVNTCGGSTTLTGSTATTDVKGCASADTIVISGDAVIANAIEGAGGDDTIVVATTGTVGSVVSGAGDDSLTWSAGTVGSIAMGDGSDVVSIASGADVSGLTLLDGGDDLAAADGFIDVLSVDGLTGPVDGSIITNWEEINVANSDVQVTDLVANDINVSDSTVVATNLTAAIVTVTGAGADTTIDGASSVTAMNTCGATTLGGTSTIGSVTGCVDPETITVTDAATVTGVLDSAGGDDTIVVATTGTVGSVVSGAGDDSLTWSAGTVGSIAMGDGSDVVSIASGADISGLTLLDGGDDLTAGDGFIDVLSVDGLSGAVDGSIITNWEEINVANSDVQVTDLVAGAVSVTDSTVVATNLTADEVTLANSTTTLDGTSVVATVNTCGGVTTLTGSTAATDVLGCASDDTIVIDGDAVVANAIEGAGGSDSVSVLGNASAAIINVAGDGSDASAATDNNNSVLVNTTGTVGTVIGGDQADAITLTAGTVGTVVAGGGADTIIANGADVTTSIDAGDGDDTVTWSAGTVAAIATGLGSDELTVSASEYDGSQVLDGGDDLTTADGMVDTLTFKNLTVAATGANVTNWENVVIDGGTVSFSDNALTTGSDAGTGLSIVNGGALDAGDAFALTGNLTVNAGSTFDGTGAGAGVYSISGNLANNGLVTTKDGVVGDTITVAGNYSGTGVLSVDINTATDTIDTLVIAGDVTGGPTTVVVNNLSPLGASGNALTVIAVGGTSAAGDFVLDGGSLTAGAFDYNLAHQGSNFVLASAVNSTGAVYQAVPMVMNGFFNNLPTLEQRVGQRQWAGTNVARGELQPSTGGWLRQRGDGLKASTTTGIATKSNSWGLQAGIDYDVEAGGDGLWVLGVTGQYGKLGSTITNPLGFGKIDAEGFGIDATATWYGTKGTYVDLQGQVNWISSDMSSSAAGSLAEGELSKAYALSAEVGHRFELDQNTTLVPQAQLTLGKLHGASFTDSAGNAVDLGNNNSTVGRLGLAYEYENNDRTDGNRAKAYVIGNILHDFSTDSTVRVAGADLSTSASGATWGEIGLGGSVTVDANKTTVYGEASYRGAFNGGSNSGLGLTAGLRVQW